MKITALAENTARDPGIGAEHGLSLYIETVSGIILFDMGQTGLFAENAEKLAGEFFAAPVPASMKGVLRQNGFHE